MKNNDRGPNGGCCLLAGLASLAVGATVFIYAVKFLAYGVGYLIDLI